MFLGECQIKFWKKVHTELCCCLFLVNYLVYVCGFGDHTFTAVTDIFNSFLCVHTVVLLTFLQKTNGIETKCLAKYKKTFVNYSFLCILCFQWRYIFWVWIPITVYLASIFVNLRSNVKLYFLLSSWIEFFVWRGYLILCIYFLKS